MNVHRATVQIKSCTILGFCHGPEEQYKIYVRVHIGHTKVRGVIMGYRSICVHVYLYLQPPVCTYHIVGESNH